MRSGRGDAAIHYFIEQLLCDIHGYQRLSCSSDKYTRAVTYELFVMLFFHSPLILYVYLNSIRYFAEILAAAAGRSRGRHV